MIVSVSESGPAAGDQPASVCGDGVDTQSRDSTPGRNVLLSWPYLEPTGVLFLGLTRICCETFEVLGNPLSTLAEFGYFHVERRADIIWNANPLNFVRKTGLDKSGVILPATGMTLLLELPDWGHRHEGLTTQRLQKRTNEMDRPIVSRQRIDQDY